MLGRFRRLLLRAGRQPRSPVLAAVRGQCLGGGLELVSLCHRIFATADAKLGQPEIVLGVFAPMASLVLPERIGRAHAEDLCLTGRIGRRCRGARDGPRRRGRRRRPDEAALAWARTHLLPRSASSLRYAVRAVRAGSVARGSPTELPVLERLYLDELMATARRGGRACAPSSRSAPPVWKNAMSAVSERLTQRLAARARRGALPRLPARDACATWKARTGGLADRLHADLRAARAPPRAGRAAGRHHGRRRRPRDHQGRRLLPVVHLPPPAQHDRARPERQPRLPRRHALSRHLRRHPQPLGHVAAAVPRQARALPRRAAGLRRRSAARSTATSSRRCRAELDGARRAAATTPEALRASIAAYNENRAPRARALRAARAASRGRCRPPSSTCCCAPALVLPVEESTRDAARVPRGSSEADDRAGRWTRRACVLTGSFCEQPPLGLIKTLERAGLLHRGRRLPAGAPLHHGATSRSTGDPLDEPGRRVPRRRDRAARRATSTTARRARSWSSACEAAAPTASSSARRASATRRCSTSRWRHARSRRAGIPWTAFKYAENTGQFQVIREQAGTFADSIKLWSEA